jgi:hypothetical protein
MTASISYLVQLLLPLYDDTGTPFPPEHHAGIRRELTARFGGVTSYSRAPAVGVWQNDSGQAERDDIVVCEVMVPKLDRTWWRSYRESLEELFKQDDLVVRVLEVDRM